MGAPPSLELSPRQARRIAVRAQLLTAPRPDRPARGGAAPRLAAGRPDRAPSRPSADLVLWSRLGYAYDPADLEDARRRRRRWSSCRAMLPPSRGHRAATAPRWPPGPAAAAAAGVAGGRSPTGWRPTTPAAATSSTRLRRRRPAAARELPDTCVVPWRSSGWTNDRNVDDAARAAWGARRGRGRRSREGRDRLWDLAERGLPRRPGRARRRRRAHPLTRGGCGRSASPGPRARSARSSRYDVGEAGEPAVVEGVAGQWRVDPDRCSTDAVRGPHRAAVAAGPAGLRPQADGRALRVRLPAGDVQARGASAGGATGRCRC